MAGELGEYCNIVKKVERGDMSLEEATPALAKELADIATYLDINALAINVDLGQAVMDKFNEVSVRVGATTKLTGGTNGVAVGIFQGRE